MNDDGWNYMLNSASIINCSFLHMKEELDQLVAGGTPMFHIDLMDGHYVPNLCMPDQADRGAEKELSAGHRWTFTSWWTNPSGLCEPSG